MDPDCQIIPMKKEHIDEAALVVAKSFLALNQLWKKYQLTEEKVLPFIRNRVVKGMEGGASSVLIKNGQIIAVSSHYDVLDYLKDPKPQSQFEMFNILEQIGAKLQKKLDISNIKSKESCYGLYGVIHPDYAHSGIALKFWWHQFNQGKKDGWKSFYTRTTNQKSYNLLKLFGAQSAAQITQELFGKQQKIHMMRLDLDKLPPFEQIQKILNAAKKKKAQSSS